MQRTLIIDPWLQTIETRTVNDLDGLRQAALSSDATVLFELPNQDALWGSGILARTAIGKGFRLADLSVGGVAFGRCVLTGRSFYDEFLHEMVIFDVRSTVDEARAAIAWLTCGKRALALPKAPPEPMAHRRDSVDAVQQLLADWGGHGRPNGSHGPPTDPSPF